MEGKEGWFAALCLRKFPARGPKTSVRFPDDLRSRAAAFWSAAGSGASRRFGCGDYPRNLSRDSPGLRNPKRCRGLRPCHRTPKGSGVTIFRKCCAASGRGDFISQRLTQIRPSSQQCLDQLLLIHAHDPILNVRDLTGFVVVGAIDAALNDGFRVLDHGR